MHTGLTLLLHNKSSSTSPFSDAPTPNSFLSSPAPFELKDDQSQRTYPSSTRSDVDHDQQLSAAVHHQETNGNADCEMYPGTLQASLSMNPNLSDEVSASPAAMFLSAFSPSSIQSRLPDDEGQVVASFTLGPIIGHGATSTIRRGYSSSGGVVAVKIVRRADLVMHGNAPQARKRLEHEAAIWSSLSHEHVLPLFSAVHTTYADYFITLLCPAGSLFDILKRDGQPALPQDDAGMMFRQVVRGLRYLHDVAMVVHRDMKLENVLVDEMGVCRIADFGMAKKIGDVDEEDDDFEPELQQSDHSNVNFHSVHRSATTSAPSKRQGRSSYQPTTPYVAHARHRNSTSSAQTTHPSRFFQPGSLPYAAPEILLPQTSEALRPPHPSQDIWALGVILYALLTGRLPFSDPFEPRLQMKILNGVYEVPTDIGRGAERVLKGCLERAVTNRWTISMVDEVAWGIGWGAEGDEVSPADSEEEGEEIEGAAKHRRVVSSEGSRSSSRPKNIVIPRRGTDQEHPSMASPSEDAAKRRSQSRSQRTQSRAPLSFSAARSASRSSASLSRRAPSPTFSALHGSIMGKNSPMSATFMSRSTSSSSSAFKDSALSASPRSSVERGRRPTKGFHSKSRSPSPSIVPSTPVDSVSSPLGFDRPNDDLHLESSRGRKKLSHTIHSPFRSAGLTADGELDVLDESGRWISSGRRSSSISQERKHSLSRVPLNRFSREERFRRPESVPPYYEVSLGITASKCNTYSRAMQRRIYSLSGTHDTRQKCGSATEWQRPFFVINTSSAIA